MPLFMAFRMISEPDSTPSQTAMHPALCMVVRSSRSTMSTRVPQSQVRSSFLVWSSSQIFMTRLRFTENASS